MKKKIKGFTLMEVIITMIIVITLSLISWPIYRGRHREYSILAEGYALIGTIKEAQINYYNEYGNFYSNNSANINPCFTTNDPVLGINAMNNRYFSYFDPCWAQRESISDGSGGWYLRGPYKHYFCAEVRSTNAGTIRLQFSLTKRYETQVLNASNVTFF